ncbi:hypothetical protein J8F10_37145 [Gemmata sp. G18]|uniref:Uncharacterized protein n=1 Tax=Gemmata palustris TaxID=2822762 RepID=A0ABS5C5F6_9BACT|nr:hypothetical protein [Gemmata palustris]MBP3960882.1 hypothetical protein [Gemmata palustris]
MTARVLAAAVLVTLSANLAPATEIRFIPIPERVACADVVAVGTVTNIEEKTIEAEQYKGGNKTQFRIAVVKVSDQVFGGGDVTHLRVAFVPKEDQPSGKLKIGTPVLEKDEEVLLFLRKRSDEGFYRLGGHFGAVKKSNKLDEAIKEAKAAGKILVDADKALKSKDQTERMTAAWLLTTRYRAYPADAVIGKTSEEPVGADESQAIVEGLLALAEKNSDAFYTAASSLNLSREDGFGPNFTPDKAKAWLKDNAKTYRIKKIVPAK